MNETGYKDGLSLSIVPTLYLSMWMKCLCTANILYELWVLIYDVEIKLIVVVFKLDIVYKHS